MLTIAESLGVAKQQLNKDESISAEVLLAYVMQQPRSHLHAWPDKILTPSQEKLFLELLARAKHGEPIAYLTQQKEFWSLDLHVTRDTLIPRPETELLIEIILKKFSAYENLRLLDLGTGTGAIAVALAHEKPSWEIFATDISQQALHVAKQNAEKYSLKNITFKQSEWFAELPDDKFDVIVSNPPYIDEEDDACEPHVKTYEPRMALFAKENGLADLKKIIFESRQFLKENGFLIVEHGFKQAESVNELFLLNGYENIQLHQDLSQLDRATSAYSPKLIAR